MPPLTAGTFSPRPYMDLTFEVLVASFVVQRVATKMDTQQVWTVGTRHVRCDIMPLADETRFLQTGQQTIATHVLHFYANETINVNNRVKFIRSKRLAGPVGSWYQILSVLQPTENIAYIRAHAQITDAPGAG